MGVALAGNSSTEGGNVTGIDVESDVPSIWHGVTGNVWGGTFVPFSFVADAGGISYFDINVGFDDCHKGKYILLNLLFSNSSAPITSLSRGNLTTIDNFIIREGENGTETFIFSTKFKTADYGVIQGVPTTYTNSPIPNTFRMGYLQDQNGDLVIIIPIVENKEGFNGSIFDLQLMVPTMNGTNVTYYVTRDLKCVKPPQGSGGGGGSGVPYYNETYEPPLPPVVPPGPNDTLPGGGPPQCEIILYCEEWGTCIDGFRYQKCEDSMNCSNTTVYRVEDCLKAEPETPIEEISKGIIPIRVRQELPCIVPILLILIILLILLLLYYRRREEEEGRRGIPK